MRRPCNTTDELTLQGHIASLANFDDGLGNTGDLTFKEVLHLFELELMADEPADIHLAGGDQRDGITEGQRVDEGAPDGELLLVDVVGVHLEVGLLRTDSEHQHLRTLVGCGDGLSLRGRQGRPPRR